MGRSGGPRGPRPERAGRTCAPAARPQYRLMARMLRRQLAPQPPGLCARLAIGGRRRGGGPAPARRQRHRRAPGRGAQLAAGRRRSQRHDILHAEAGQPVGRARVVLRQRAVRGAGGRGGRAARAALQRALGARCLHLGDDRQRWRRRLALDYHLLLGLLGGVARKGPAERPWTPPGRSLRWARSSFSLGTSFFAGRRR